MEMNSPNVQSCPKDGQWLEKNKGCLKDEVPNWNGKVVAIYVTMPKM